MTTHHALQAARYSGDDRKLLHGVPHATEETVSRRSVIAPHNAMSRVRHTCIHRRGILILAVRALLFTAICCSEMDVPTGQ